MQLKMDRELLAGAAVFSVVELKYAKRARLVAEHSATYNWAANGALGGGLKVPAPACGSAQVGLLTAVSVVSTLRSTAEEDGVMLARNDVLLRRPAHPSHRNAAHRRGEQAAVPLRHGGGSSDPRQRRGGLGGGASEGIGGRAVVEEE